MADIFKSINESIFKGVKEISWYDRVGIMNLDENRYVQFELDDIGTKDNFVGYWVEVYNKNNGLISKKFFRFQYHMEFIHKPNTQNYYHIWYYQGILDWYISRPKDTKKYVKTLMDYIEKIK